MKQKLSLDKTHALIETKELRRLLKEYFDAGFRMAISNEMTNDN